MNGWIVGSGGNKKLAEALLTSASQVESLTPQLVNAGRIRMTYPESKAADVHFENLRQQYAETMQRTRALCDEATDSADFVRTSEEQMQKHSFLCEEAIAQTHPQKMVDNTAAIARLANRVILVAKQESDNSEDQAFIQRVNQTADVLQQSKFQKNISVHAIFTIIVVVVVVLFHVYFIKFTFSIFHPYPYK